MGRIMSFDQDGRGVRDFDKSEHDFLRRYGRTPEEVMDENAKLRDENTELRKLGGFMLRCISQYHDCADCLVNGEHCEISYIEADARELGVTA